MQPHLEAVERAVRAIENRRLFPPAQLLATSSWWLRTIPAAVAVICLVLYSGLFQSRSPRPALTICEVPCQARAMPLVPDKPLVPVERYESLFEENL